MSDGGYGFAVEVQDVVGTSNRRLGLLVGSDSNVQGSFVVAKIVFVIKSKGASYLGWSDQHKAITALLDSSMPLKFDIIQDF